jgi:hypothetical protein
VSGDSGVATLNRQLLGVLSGRGVPNSVFRQLQSEAISAFRACCDSLAGVQNALTYLSNDPADDDVRRLIQLGLFGEAFVVQRVARHCADKLDAIRDRAQIPVRQSRRVLLVSDPTGVLEVGRHV